MSLGDESVCLRGRRRQAVLISGGTRKSRRRGSAKGLYRTAIWGWGKVTELHLCLEFWLAIDIWSQKLDCSIVGPSVVALKAQHTCMVRTTARRQVAHCICDLFDSKACPHLAVLKSSIGWFLQICATQRKCYRVMGIASLHETGEALFVHQRSSCLMRWLAVAHWRQDAW